MPRRSSRSASRGRRRRQSQKRWVQRGSTSKRAPVRNSLSLGLESLATPPVGAPDDSEQGAVVDGFDKVVAENRLRAAALSPQRIVSGHGDDEDITQVLVRLDPPGDFKAVHAG